jgi:hypothetical protein
MATSKAYLSAFLDKINYVETHWDVASFQNYEIKIWPLIRLAFASLWQEQERGIISQGLEQPHRIKNPKWNYASPILFLRRMWAKKCGFFFGKQQAYFWNNGTWGVLLASSKMEKACERHLFFDPLKSFLDPKNKSLNIFWNDACIKTEIKDSLAPLLAKAAQISKYFSAPISEKEKQLIEEIKEYLGLGRLDFVEIKKQAGFILALSHILEGALYKKGIQAFYLICFYQPVCFAFALACRRLKIPCVEFQHGQQGDSHYMYSRWENYPKGGYELIPSDFWCWGEMSAVRFRQWAKKEGVHRVWVGGSPKLAAVISDPLLPYKPRKWNRPIQKALVCLQFTELPDFVWESINESPEIVWLIRLHPRFAEEAESFQALCKQKIKSTSKWELERPTTGNYYELLREVDVQLTGWSTTAYEALSFEVPTILIHANGAETMREFVQAGTFKYAGDSKTLLNCLRNPAFEVPKGDPYIKTDPVGIEETFQNILIKGNDSPKNYCLK